MFIQKHFTLHITVFFFFLNTHNFEVWTLDPQYLKKKIISNDKHKFLRKKIDLKIDTGSPISKKKLFLLTNISLRGRVRVGRRTRKKQLQKCREAK